MKCSSRRNCDRTWTTWWPPKSSLNEVQFPKELRQVRGHLSGGVGVASMKCSSRRNCDQAFDNMKSGIQTASMK